MERRSAILVRIGKDLLWYRLRHPVDHILAVHLKTREAKCPVILPAPGRCRLSRGGLARRPMDDGCAPAKLER